MAVEGNSADLLLLTLSPLFLDISEHTESSYTCISSSCKLELSGRSIVVHTTI